MFGLLLLLMVQLLLIYLFLLKIIDVNFVSQVAMRSTKSQRQHVLLEYCHISGMADYFFHNILL